MLDRLVDDEVRARLERVEIPFNRYGLDEFGLSKEHLGWLYTLLGRLYHQYFRVRTSGIEHVPAHGRFMVIGNHSGGLPVDGGMVLASCFFEMEPPRIVHGMVEKFAQYLPFLSQLFSRWGQLPGLPEHALRLLEADRPLMVFPEGARGTGKLYRDRYKLVRFGTGFVRIAMQTRTPIVPFAFIGGEEALPVVYHSKVLAKVFRAPYFPVTPYGLPVPLPFPCQLYYSEPMLFEGTGTESDEEVEQHVEKVRARVAELIEQGRVRRREERAAALQANGGGAG
jgi:1-acyl-sn-glycerol-3-phosphate acyltransferase